MSERSVKPRGWATVSLAVLALGLCPLARAQVKLEYKFPEGKKLTFKTTLNTSQTLKIGDNTIETEVKRTVVTSQAFGKKRDESTQPISEKVESLATEMSLPGGINVTYDSKDPNSKIDNPALSFLEDVFKLASQMEYTVVIDPKNKVKAIEGMEKIKEKAEKLEGTAKAALGEALDAEHMKKEFEQSHGNLPEILARPGEPWERTEILRLGGGQTLTFHKKYEYAGTVKHGDQTLEKIDVKTTEVKYEMDPNSASPLKVLKSDLKVESGDGVMLFDREAGHVVSTKGKTRMKGPMTFEAGGQELPGELDLTLEINSELQPATK